MLERLRDDEEFTDNVTELNTNGSVILAVGILMSIGS